MRLLCLNKCVKASEQCALQQVFFILQQFWWHFCQCRILVGIKGLLSQTSVDANQQKLLRLYHSANIPFKHNDRFGGKKKFSFAEWHSVECHSKPKVMQMGGEGLNLLLLVWCDLNTCRYIYFQCYCMIAGLRLYVCANIWKCTFLFYTFSLHFAQNFHLSTDFLCITTPLTPITESLSQKKGIIRT